MTTENRMAGGWTGRCGEITGFTHVQLIKATVLRF